MSKIFCTRGRHELQEICPDARGVPCSPPVASEQFTNEGTAGIWLPEKKLLKLTVFEVGWLWATLMGLHDKEGGRWPTAKPGENGKAIPTTMPKRIAEKLMDLMCEPE